MAIRIFPTENDVGVDPGDGRAPTEENLSKWITSIRGPHSRFKGTFKIDTGGVTELTAGGFGFEFVSGDATTLTLGPGDADILGFEVESDANIVTALTAATYNWVFLQLTTGGAPSKVTGAQLVVTTSSTFANGPGAPPTDSILLWCFLTSIAVITQTFDFRSSATDQITGEYLGDGNFSQNIDIGLRPKLLYIVSQDPPEIACWSEPDFANEIVPTPTHFGPWIINMEDGVFGASGLARNDGLRPRLLETGFQVALGPTFINRTRIFQPVPALFNPPAISSLSGVSESVTVTGAAVGDAAYAEHEGSFDDRVVVKAAVSAADTVAVRFSNPSDSDIGVGDLTDALLHVVVFHRIQVSASLNVLDNVYNFVAWY